MPGNDNEIIVRVSLLSGLILKAFIRISIKVEIKLHDIYVRIYCAIPTFLHKFCYIAL